MAVRHFEYEQARSTMNEIKSEAQKVDTYLKRCQQIINENVGVSNRWTGQRADDFKKRFEAKAAEFKEFVSLINQYANRVEDSYREHKAFDQAGK